MLLPKTIVLASGNAGKIREIARLLDRLSITVVAQSDLGVAPVAETGTTFAENSLIKARHAAAVTGLPAIADDSGLSVDALNGAPGVYSARYAGKNASDEQNVDKLLTAMKGVRAAERSAAFHCVASFVLPDNSNEILAEGVWRGSILDERQGVGGFGYDPVFLDPKSGASAATLTADEKNTMSHRGQALEKLFASIEQRYA